MATLEQLSTALKNADKAGDTEAAKKLANAISQMRGQPAPSPSLGQVAGDVATQGIAGLEKLGAATLGLPGDVGRIHQAVESKLSDVTKDSPIAHTALKILDAPGRALSAGLSLLPGYDQIQEFAGPLPEPKTGYGQWANAVGEYGPLVASPIRAGVKALTSRGARNVLRTDIEALRAAKEDAYKIADTTIGKETMTAPDYHGLQLATNRAANEAGRGGMFGDVAHDLHPKSFRMVDAINRIGKDIASGNGPPPTFKDIEQGRQMLRKITNDSVTAQGNLTHDGGMAEKLIEKIDTHLDAIPGTGAYKFARASHARLRKAEDIEDALFRAETQTSANYSQANFENATRQQFKNLANRLQKRNWAGWSKEEQGALMNIVDGKNMQNATRILGKASPSGGLSKMLYAAFGYSHPLIAGTAAIATKSARAMSAQAGMKNIEKLQEIVSGRQSALPTPKSKFPSPLVFGNAAYKSPFATNQ